ncbi:uncharacterized protein LOC103862488 [Brassica rapa]|uniref:uncharacterized protein LOC103862488 n=1 Tax=Brassica campestris TaxID=3711 RepID=UPI0004F156CC|nr:uncharacterized protein LOC103862488 [Brassica rapa]XP_048634048.1 uncharacterized protein LOC125608143 [Brassica napus]
MRQPAKKATRIFVERYGEITDLYMPKDPKRSGHRGFGFATFAENGVADVYPGDLMKSVDKSWDMECRAQDNQDQTGGTGHTNNAHLTNIIIELLALSVVLKLHLSDRFIESSMINLFVMFLSLWE